MYTIREAGTQLQEIAIARNFKNVLLVGRGSLRKPIVAALGLVLPAPAAAGNPDFLSAAIAIPSNASTPESKAAAMHAANGPAFVLGRAGQIQSIGPRPAGAPDKAEGFTFRSAAEGSTAPAVATGYDDGGVVFGTGYPLRRLRMGRQRLELEPGLDVTTPPRISVRGGAGGGNRLGSMAGPRREHVTDRKGWQSADIR